MGWMIIALAVQDRALFLFMILARRTTLKKQIVISTGALTLFCRGGVERSPRAGRSINSIVEDGSKKESVLDYVPAKCTGTALFG